MKKINGFLMLSALIVPLAFGLLGPITVSAAVTPALGVAATYGVLASTYTNTTAGTVINGDVGFTTPPALAPGGIHPNYGSGVPYATAGIDQGNALSLLAAESCTFTFAAGAIDLSTDTTHGPIGIYTPGVYCSTGAMSITGLLNLSGSGTYIFRPVGALDTAAGAVVALTGASACDVFWTPSGATTLAANSTFFGTVIDDAAITIGANTTWTGRALSFGGTVTTDTDTITVPSCAPAVVVPPVVPIIVATSTPSVTSTTTATTTVSTNNSSAPSNVPTPVVLALVESVPVVLVPIVPVSVILASAIVPNLPQTGAGGYAAQNRLIILGFVMLLITGLVCLRKEGSV